MTHGAQDLPLGQTVPVYVSASKKIVLTVAMRMARVCVSQATKDHSVKRCARKVHSVILAVDDVPVRMALVVMS